MKPLFLVKKQQLVCVCVSLTKAQKSSLFSVPLTRKHKPSSSFSLQLMWSDSVMISECSHSSGDVFEFTESDRTQTHGAVSPPFVLLAWLGSCHNVWATRIKTIQSCVDTQETSKTRTNRKKKYFATRIIETMYYIRGQSLQNSCMTK